MWAGMAWMKLSLPAAPGWIPGLGGISTRPSPFSRKAARSRSMIAIIGTPAASTSARDRYRMCWADMGPDSIAGHSVLDNRLACPYILQTDISHHQPGGADVQSRAEEGEHRAVDPVAARDRAAARLRHRQDDR